jgi:hypothetical protein
MEEDFFRREKYQRGKCSFQTHVIFSQIEMTADIKTWSASESMINISSRKLLHQCLNNTNTNA